MRVQTKKGKGSQPTRGFNTEEFVTDQFTHWLKDTENMEKVRATNSEFFEPCIIIELFVAHIKRSQQMSYGGFDILYTPFARVIHVASMCSDTYKELKPGDIISVNDHMTTQEVNADYVDHMANVGRKDYIAPVEIPRPHRRRIWQWIINGYLFHPDKLAYVTQPQYITVSMDNVHSFKGPYVFKVAQHEIIHKPSYVFGVKV